MFSSFGIRRLRHSMSVIAAVLSCLANVTKGASDIPDFLLQFGIVWGDENAKKVRAGIETRGDPESLTAKVVVFSAGTNGNWRYLAPPATKFATVKLMDSHGTVTEPLPGMRLDGNLPQRLAIKDLPREPIRGTKQRGSGGGLRDWLYGLPAKLSEFTIQNVYRIEKEGDYTLTVAAVVYEFPSDYKSNVSLASNEQFVTRIDLPTVTTKIHLKPSTQTKH